MRKLEGSPYLSLNIWKAARPWSKGRTFTTGDRQTNSYPYSSGRMKGLERVLELEHYVRTQDGPVERLGLRRYESP